VGGGGPDFEKEVRPVLQQYCFSCHGPEKQKGKLRLDTLSPDLVNERSAAEHWHEVRAALNLEEMPPKEKPAPNDAERKIILAWLDDAIAKANETPRPTACPAPWFLHRDGVHGKLRPACSKRKPAL
jgi:uncharacterized membrane protein